MKRIFAMAMTLIFMGTTLLGAFQPATVHAKEVWTKEDFMYDKGDPTFIVGLTQQGMEKAKTLKQMEIPQGTKKIGNQMFLEKKTNSLTDPSMMAGQPITSLVLPDSVEEIGDYAFYSCRLQHIVWGKHIKHIGNWSFSNNQLKELRLPEGITHLGGAAFRENNIKTLYLPQGLLSIGAGAFFSNALEEVVIPQSVTDIYGGAFYGNQLQKIQAPEHMKTHPTGAMIFGNQHIRLEPKSSPMDLSAYGYNKVLGLFPTEQLKRLSDGRYMFAENAPAEITLSFSVPEKAYGGTLTLVRPSSVEEGTQTEQTTEDWTKMEETLRRLEEEKKALDHEKKQMEAQIQELSKKLEQCQQTSHQQKEQYEKLKAEYREKEREYQEKEKEYQGYQEKEKQYQAELEQLKDENKYLTKEVQALEEDLKEAKYNLEAERAKEEPQKEKEKEWEKKIADLEKKISEKEKLLKEKDEETDRLLKDLEEGKKKESALKQELSNLKKEKEELEKRCKELSSTGNCPSKDEQKKWQEELKKWEQRLEEQNKRIQKVEDSLKKQVEELQKAWKEKGDADRKQQEDWKKTWEEWKKQQEEKDKMAQKKILQVDEVKEGDKTLSGKTHPKWYVEVWHEKKRLGGGSADEKGYFQISLKEKAKADQVLKVCAESEKEKEDPISLEVTVQKQERKNTNGKDTTGSFEKKYQDFAVFQIGKNYYNLLTNGKKTTVYMDVCAYIEQDRTMMPLRYVAYALGFNVEYDDATRTAIFSNQENPILPKKTLKLNIDTGVMKDSDGKIYHSDVKPVILQGRVHASLTNIAKAFGATNGTLEDGKDHTIEWDNKHQAVYVFKFVK